MSLIDHLSILRGGGRKAGAAVGFSNFRCYQKSSLDARTRHGPQDVRSSREAPSLSDRHCPKRMAGPSGLTPGRIRARIRKGWQERPDADQRVHFGTRDRNTIKGLTGTIEGRLARRGATTAHRQTLIAGDQHRSVGTMPDWLYRASRDAGGQNPSEGHRTARLPEGQ